MSLPASRSEALAIGADRYFTGQPCKHGHLAERYVTGSCVACRQAHYQSRRPEFVERARRHRDVNREEISEQRRRKYRADMVRRKDVRDAYLRRRWFYARANNLRGDGSATAKELAALWKSQRGRCALTGRRLTRENAEFDHIIPRVRGGSDAIGNLRWTVKPANRAKRDLLDDEFLELCRDVVSIAEARA